MLLVSRSRPAEGLLNPVFGMLLTRGSGAGVVGAVGLVVATGGTDEAAAGATGTVVGTDDAVFGSAGT